MARDDIAKISGTTAVQRDAWRAAAGGEARGFAAWARDALDAAARGAAGLPVRSAEAAALRTELATLRGELNRGIGSLLDQIATKLHVDAHAGRAPDATAGIEAALARAADELAGLRASIDRGLAALRPRHLR